jgi:hypothetical protein
MTREVIPAAVVALGILCGAGKADAGEGGALNDRLQKYLNQRKAELDQIPAERREALKQVAQYVRRCASSGQASRLTFICTHNSRRSHMAQLWAAAAAAYYGVPGVQTFSGGTEATAFNPRAVAALERAGFLIEKGPEAGNPRFRVRLADGAAPLVCFSKVYRDEPNPQKGYCAVMVCSQADRNCPVVHGATTRVAVAYEDPKAADGTAKEAATYDERCAQIAREMLYAFSLVKN